MVTPDDHKKLRYLGRASAMTELAGLMRGGTLPAEAAESYAAGLADGVREFVTALCRRDRGLHPAAGRRRPDERAPAGRGGAARRRIGRALVIPPPVMP